MKSRKAVLLNDTDFLGQHFGCQKVMRTIHGNLERRGIQVSRTIKVGMPWHLMPTEMEQIKSAGLVVINGEGTLHHGKRKGKWLLDAAQFARENGAKVALINTLWQDNPDSWAQIVDQVDHIWCRDSRSAGDLSKLTGRNIPWLGDLSLCSGASGINVDRGRVIMVGDSVHTSITKKLAELSLKLDDISISPLTTNFKYVSPRMKGLRKQMRIFAGKVFRKNFERRFGKVDFAADEWDYLAKLANSRLLITGRFHAVCMAVTTTTPFISIKSNSWKIEMLLEDVGLSKKCLVSLEELTAEKVLQEDWAYSDMQVANIASQLTAWKSKAAEMFDEIVEG